jgi:hypothetical protein
MDESCNHEFDDMPSVFTGTVQSRKCRKCQSVEVMLTSGAWVDIPAYLQRHLANRSSDPT